MAHARRCREGRQPVLRHASRRSRSSNGQYTVFGQVISGMDVVEKTRDRRPHHHGNREARQSSDVRALRAIGIALDQLGRDRAFDRLSELRLSITALATDLRREVIVRDRGTPSSRARARCSACRRTRLQFVVRVEVVVAILGRRRARHHSAAFRPCRRM